MFSSGNYFNTVEFAEEVTLPYELNTVFVYWKSIFHI
jgi:hypothetical protein